MTQEDELMKKIRQGDKEALNELISLYYPEILRYCLWHAPSRSLAEDAVQETFLKAVRYMGRYNHQGKFRPFLYRIAANVCVDMRRKRRPEEVSLEETSDAASYAEKGFEEAASELDMRRLVLRLPRELREIVLLRFSQELTLREIAQVLGLPLRTVQSRLRSALRQIKGGFREGEWS